MASALRPVAALLISMFLVLVGNGLLGTILPLGAKAHGFSELQIGLLGSAYFAGMLIGAVMNPRVVRHSGHVRAFTASIATAIVATLSFSVFEDPWAWLLFRFMVGYSTAGLYATMESWLQGRTENASRGSVLAVYSVVQYAGWALGNQLLHLESPTSFVLFSLSASLLALGIVPLMVTTSDPPERPTSPKLPILWLLRTSPIAIVGMFLIGMANGAFWSLSPVYASSMGLSAAMVGTFMTVLLLGAAALQIPIGRLSDRFNRRSVLLGLLFASIAIQSILVVSGSGLGLTGLLIIGFALGSVMATPYYVLAAHVNDRTGRENAVGVAAVLLFVFCVGGIIGPVTAAEAMARFGNGALFFHNAAVHGLLAVYVLWRMLSKGAPTVRIEETPHVRAT